MPTRSPHDQPSRANSVILDATGLRCPLPVLRARKALRGLTAGETLEVLVTDPAAPADFEAFCRETGHSLLGIDRSDVVSRIRIRKKG